MTVDTIFAGTNDAELRCNSATYLTARSGAGTLLATTGATTGASGQELFSGQYYCYELALDFDTSGIPATAVISSAVLTLQGHLKGATSSGAAIHRARLYDWGATATGSDFVAGASLSALPLLAHIAQSAVSTAAYTDFIDDAMAANIVKGGHTRMLIVSDRHEAGTTPGSGTEYVIWRHADWAGTTSDPKLVITYTVGALAEAASGSGTAPNSSVSVAPSAGVAAGTGAVFTAVVQAFGVTNAPAVNAAGTGQAFDPATVVAPTAGNAGGTGSANQPAASVVASAGNAAGTSVAENPSASVAPSAETAAATGTAFDAAVAAVEIRDVAAGAAAGLGQAFDTTSAVAPTAGDASGAGTAFDATVLIASIVDASAGNAAATGGASDATAAVAPKAGLAAGSGAAAAPKASVAPTAGAAAGSGQAFDAAALGARIAPAVNAAGTGQAFDASVWIEVHAGLASGTGQAFNGARMIDRLGASLSHELQTGAEVEWGVVARGDVGHELALAAEVSHD